MTVRKPGARRGRPPLAPPGEPLTRVEVRLTATETAAVDAEIARRRVAGLPGRQRATVLRDLVRTHLGTDPS